MAILAAGIHILVFPFPAQGHMIPLLDLTHKLHRHGFNITILVTPKNLPLLNPLLSANPSIKTLVLPFPSHPSFPYGVENLKDLAEKRGAAVAMIRCLGQLYDPLLNWFNSHPSPPLAIISDMFLGWTSHLAKQLNIRQIVFSPSGAMALSVIFSLWRSMPPQENRSDENYVVSFSEIPNCPKYPWWQVSPIYRSYIKGDPDSEFIKDSFRCNLVSWGLVINSFSELEGIVLDYLKKELGHDRVWAVGPLLPSDNTISGPTERGGPSSIAAHDVMTWLDKCEDHKVVYVCFGSQTTLTNDQMEQVASSLESSGVNFIWCVKDYSKYSNILSGFEDRVARRGLIIKGWAPQVLILSHRAVGVFLTHCGWNSVLEGIVAGVPMLAWPMGADQFVNASLLVDELKVAVRVCEGATAVPNSVELARVLMESVSENRSLRERVRKLNGVALDAIKDCGSSAEDFNILVENMEKLKPEESYL